MKQLSIFAEPTQPATWQLYIDGAARKNPGPAGAGIVLLKENVIIKEAGIFLGTKTNNQAEYSALLFGILYAKKYMHARDFLKIKSDSQLLVRQISGEYAIKNEHLQHFYKHLKELLYDLNYTIEHVYREDNTLADKMANVGIDKKVAIPDEYKDIWRKYEQIF